jgi:NAD-dependent deacetylase sirtuin 5
MPSLTNPDLPPLFITQNVDSLSPRALEELRDDISSKEMKLAQERLYEIHGSLSRTVCTQCKHINTTYDPLLAPSDTLSAKEISAGSEVPPSQLPRCGGPDRKNSNRYGQCGGLLRPAVVWFGEYPEKQGEIAAALPRTELLIVVGTSSTVT